ncbi:hypothetical protein ACFLSQ_01350 [Bacteroidota bacterium]
MNENQPNQTNEAAGKPPSSRLITSVKRLWSALNNTNEKITNLLAENRELKLRAGEIEKLWKRYNEMKAIMPGLEKKAETADKLNNENIELKNESRHLQTSLNELRDVENNFMLAQKEITDKNKILSDYLETIKQQQETISENVIKLAEDEKLQNSYREEAEKLQKDIEYKENLLQSKNQEIEDGTTEIKRLNALKITYEDKIKSLDKYLQISDEKYRKAENDKANLNNEIAEFSELSAEHEDIIENNKNLKEQLIAANNNLANKNNEFTDIRNELDEANKKLIELENKITIKDRDLQVLKEIGDKQSDIVEENNLFRNRIEELRKEIEEMIEAKNDANNKINSLNSELKKIEEKNLNKENECNELQTIIGQKENNINELKLKAEKSLAEQLTSDLNIENKDELLKTIDKYINKLEKIV